MRRHVLISLLSAACLSAACSPSLLTSDQKKHERHRARLIADHLEAIHTEIDLQRGKGGLLVLHAQKAPAPNLGAQLFTGENALAVALDLVREGRLDQAIPDSGEHLCYWIHQPRLALEPEIETCRQLRTRAQDSAAAKARLAALDVELDRIRDAATRLQRDLARLETKAGRLDSQQATLMLQADQLGKSLADHHDAVATLKQQAGDLHLAHEGTSHDVGETSRKVHLMADFLQEKAKEWEERMRALISTLEAGN